MMRKLWTEQELESLGFERTTQRTFTNQKNEVFFICESCGFISEKAKRLLSRTQMYYDYVCDVCGLKSRISLKTVYLNKSKATETGCFPAIKLGVK